jgi:U1 small nuclear ribonucleoprotein 70kDa
MQHGGGIRKPGQYGAGRPQSNFPSGTAGGGGVPRASNYVHKPGSYKPGLTASKPAGASGGAHAGNRNRPAYSGQTRFRFPPDVVALFAPRPPLEYRPPPRRRRRAPARRPQPIGGVSGLIGLFETREEFENKRLELKKKIEEFGEFETPAMRRARIAGEKAARAAKIAARHRERYAPMALKSNSNDCIAAKDTAFTDQDNSDATDGNCGDDENAGKAERMRGPNKARPRKVPKPLTVDAFNTLFIGRLSRAVTATMLRAEFSKFGPVVRAVVPVDGRGIPVSYGFVEYADERGLKAGYRGGMTARLDGRRVVVDVERGRTVKGWLPNRLDGPNNAAAKAGSAAVERATRFAARGQTSREV